MCTYIRHVRFRVRRTCCSVTPPFRGLQLRTGETRSLRSERVRLRAGPGGVGAPLGPRLPRACGEWRPLASAHRVWVEMARDSRRTHAGATQVTGTSGAGRAGSWRPGCEPRPGPALAPFPFVFVAHVRPTLLDWPVCREKLVRCLHFYIYILPFRNMISEVFYYKRRIKGHIRTHSSNGWIRPPGNLVKHLCLCTPKSSTAT